MKKLNPPKQQPPDELTTAYTQWQTDPSQTNLHKVVSALTPTLKSAVSSFAGNDPSSLAISRAKLLAINAVKTFDSKKGASLKSHIFMQLQPLRQQVPAMSQAVPVPVRQHRLTSGMLSEVSKFTSEHGREPSDIELADKMGVSTKRLAKVRLSARAAPGQEMADPYTVSENDAGQAWTELVYHDEDPIGRTIMEHKLGMNGKPKLSGIQIAKKLRLSPAAVSQRAASIAARLQEMPEGWF